MKFFRLSLVVLLTLSFSCTKNEITPPPVNPDTNLVGTTTISNYTMKNMEGIYTLSDGNGGLGSQFVCKISKYKISFFSNQSGIFIILKYGLNPTDNSIQFSGFWRFSETAEQGLASFSVAAADGATGLLQNGTVANLKMKGNFTNGGGTHTLTLQFSSQFSTYAKNNPFVIFGHHGVQTGVGPPYSENSIGGVLHDEEYGVSGIEFDVRLTKDKVPICLHDNAVNIRLTEKGPLSGEPSQYPFALLENYIRLVDGSKIPSVEQVLHAFVVSTTMKYVWLDLKGDEDIFKYMEPIVRAAYARNDSLTKVDPLNRQVVIFTGMPSSDVINEFLKQPTYSSGPNPLPTLCEETLQKAIDNKSLFFGPRYSEGLLLGDVDKAHSLGIKVFSWTLNDKTIIRNYLLDGRFDGFISDYPAYVAYDFYTNF